MNTNDTLRGKFLVASAALLLLVQGCAALGNRSTPGSYAVAERVTIGGNGGWEFIALDQFRQRLIITSGDLVQGWSIQSKKLVGGIGGTAGVHELALAEDLMR